MKIRKILALSLVILSLAAMFALPISANSGSSTSVPRIYFIKYFEGNDTAVLQEVVYFQTLNFDYQLQVTGDDLYFGNVTFNFDVPDESQSYTYLSVVNMIGFSMVGYRSDLHTEPTYMIDYAPGLLWNGTIDLENSGTPYWICQLFVDDYYTGSDGLTGSNIWSDIIDETPDDDVTSPPWVYIMKYYEGNDVFTYNGLCKFDRSYGDYLLTVTGSDSNNGSATFSFDQPDESQSFVVNGLTQLIGFSFISYYSTPHTEPTYMASYDSGLIYNGSVDLSNPGSQDIFILQIFVSNSYYGSDSFTDPWRFLFDNTNTPGGSTFIPDYPYFNIDSHYQDIKDDLRELDSALIIETPPVGDFFDAINSMGIQDRFNPSVISIISGFSNSHYVLFFLIVVFTFALIAYILFGKRG